MELPMAAAIAILFGAGTYLILRPNLIRLVMGFGLYSNATNLLLITMGGYSRTNRAPFVAGGPGGAAGLMDPLPPDIILTAIVISFAVSALFMIVCYRIYLDNRTDNPQELPTDADFGIAPGAAAALPAVPQGDDGRGPAAGARMLDPSPGAVRADVAAEGRPGRED